MDRPRRLDLGLLLTRAEAAAPVGVVDAMAAALLEMLGAREVSFLIADFGGRALNRLGHSAASGEPGSRSEEISGRVRLEGTPYGAALARQRSVLLRDGDDTRVLAPVTSRGEAVGVLELVLPFEPAGITVEDVELAAHQLAYMVIANRRYTDLFEWGQRTVPVSLAAEIQRRLLPASFTCEADQFTLAGWLEPAGQVGGDTFDFSLDRDTLHVSMTDAMGHSVRSSLLATLVVGALRNTRRRGASLVEQAHSAHEALLSFTEREVGFVTGQLVRVDLVAQRARVLNAGHPPPFRLREARVAEIELTAQEPFGAVEGASWSEQQLPLEAGDRLLFLTDGMLERNAESLDMPALMLASGHLHPREAIQYLTHTVPDAFGGELPDDATALCTSSAAAAVAVQSPSLEPPSLRGSGAAGRRARLTRSSARFAQSHRGARLRAARSSGTVARPAEPCAAVRSAAAGPARPAPPIVAATDPKPLEIAGVIICMPATGMLARGSRSAFVGARDRLS